MRNIKLVLEYDGTNFEGWQSQSHGKTIQDVVSMAIQKMTEEKVVLRGASRTDAGVHALGQVATFQTNRTIPCEGFLKGLNNLLPEDIRVVDCEEMPFSFHPLKDAVDKTYHYLLLVGAKPSALWRNRVWQIGKKLDLEAMQQASTYLVGEHDFKSFQGPLSAVKSTVRCVKEVTIVENKGDSHILSITITANGFLKYMVRNIVGTLVEVGEGRRSPQDISELLKAKDRRKAGITAPAHGLYLVCVNYSPAGGGSSPPPPSPLPASGSGSGAGGSAGGSAGGGVSPPVAALRDGPSSG